MRIPWAKIIAAVIVVAAQAWCEDRDSPICVQRGHAFVDWEKQVKNRYRFSETSLKIADLPDRTLLIKNKTSTIRIDWGYCFRCKQWIKVEKEVFAAESDTTVIWQQRDSVAALLWVADYKTTLERLSKWVSNPKDIAEKGYFYYEPIITHRNIYECKADLERDSAAGVELRERSRK